MAAVLALLSSVMWGTADFLGGTASRKFKVPVVTGLSQFIGLIFAAMIATALGAWNAPLDYVPWAIVASIAGAAGLMAYYAALASGTMGVVSPIAALGVLVPLVAGIVGGDQPSPAQWVGIVLALVGVTLASGPEVSGASGARPVILAVVAAGLFGISLLAIAVGARTSVIMTMTGMRVVTVTLFGIALLVALARGSRPLTGVADGWAMIVTIGIFDVAANLLFGEASTRGMLALVAVLGSVYPVVTVLLAAILHGERLRPVEYAGIAVAFVGVALVAAG